MMDSFFNTIAIGEVIHFYKGCFAQHTDDQYQITTHIIDGRLIDRWNSNMKPFLTRMRDMTNDDADVLEMVTESHRGAGSLKTVSYMAEVTRVLAKKGYDLFGLIESNQAIDMKSIPV